MTANYSADQATGQASHRQRATHPHGPFGTFRTRERSIVWTLPPVAHLNENQDHFDKSIDRGTAESPAKWFNYSSYGDV
jgi:hypothetical protein